MMRFDDDAMRLPSAARLLSNRSGMTLIELMVVVAIVGVLATIGGVTYTKYLRQGKIAKLEQYAMEVKKGQEQFKARNGTYYDIDCAYYKDCSSDKRTEWEEYLEFSHESLKKSTIRVRTNAGSSSDSCDKACPGITPDQSGLWYAVKVSQDLNPGSSERTTVYTDSDRETTVVLNEGE